MSGRFLEELWRIAGLAFFAVVVGWAVDHVALVLLITLGIYLGWHLYNLRRLERWLREGKSYTPPESYGLWGQIFGDIYTLQRRHKKRNKRLVKLISRFRETTEAMPDGVVVMDANGQIDWWNEVAAHLLDLKYPTDVNQRITNLVRNPQFQSFFSRADKDEILNFPAPIDESKTVSVRLTPYGKNQTLLVVRDVTLLQRVEQMRRDFVANISHELRTPLTVMTGFLEAMSGELEKQPDKQWQRSLNLMQQQAKRMYRLVEDLMLLSQLEKDTKQIKHDVVAVPQMLSTLEEEAEIISSDRHHSFSFEVDPDLFIFGDSKELDSAFHNLVVNAINYTPEGGAIRIRWYQDEHGAHFEVSDTGIGIPRHHLARITERFYRVDVARSRETGGSGLGLAIVKHALQRHDAKLRIDSEIGRGSTFICDFPASAIVSREKAMSAL